MISRANHPRLFDDVDTAKKFYDDADMLDKYAVFNPSLSETLPDALLIFNSYSNEKIINEIECIMKTTNLSIDEALPVIASFFPYNIIDEYYKFDISEKIVPNANDDSSYYVISYALDKERHDHHKKNLPYGGLVDVIIEEKDGIISNFTLGFGTPKWMKFLEKNGYHSEPWQYDFLKHK